MIRMTMALAMLTGVVLLSACGNSWDQPTFAGSEGVRLTHTGKDPLRFQRLAEDPYDRTRPVTYELVVKNDVVECVVQIEPDRGGAGDVLELPVGTVFLLHQSTRWPQTDKEIDRRPFPYWHPVWKRNDIVSWRASGVIRDRLGMNVEVACVKSVPSSGLSVRKPVLPYAQDLDVTFRQAGLAYSQGGFKQLYYGNDAFSYGNIGPYPAPAPGRPELQER